MDNAGRFPDKTALVLDDHTLTYSECVERTRQLSGALKAIGLNEGSHIGLLLNNSLEHVIALLAAADLGATIVPMNTTISEKDLLTAIKTADIDYIIGSHTTLKEAFDHSQNEQQEFPVPRERCIAVGVVVDGCHSYSDIIESVPDSYELCAKTFDDEQDFILTMTSGSTNDPKPIVFTQGIKIRRCFSAQESYDLTDRDIILVATPLYHSISQRLIFTPLILGATCVIMRKFNPANWLAQVNKHQVSFTIAVAPQLEAVLQPVKEARHKASSLRCVVSCCALLNGEAKKQLIKELQCDFHECYGASEVGVISNLGSKDPESKVHSVGRAVPGAEIQIVDNNGNAAPTGEIGEITCKSLMRFSRYYKNEQATRQSLIDDFFHTGDMGYMDEDGFLVFSGRKKELIITGGANVFPKDIEAVLNEHPKVKECAVIGVADKQFGEAVLALVIAEDGAALSGRDLQHYCLHRLADVQKPMAYVFVDDFPRTSLGKIIKPKLAEQYADYDATANLRSIINKNIET
ncbi:MAG: acyl--CoA ligase [Rhodospirillales bacterium]|nr:acyl--CoA ligase [Rhodospirillales bacterium]